MTTRGRSSSNGPSPSPTPDWSAVEFAAILARRLEHYPLSDAFETRDRGGRAPRAVWYTSQREHVVGWLRELDGPGAYGRASRGLGARHFYHHFQCAPGLLWVAEALGETGDAVRLAADAASGAGRPASQCAAIRRVIPWSRIADLALGLAELRAGVRS